MPRQAPRGSSRCGGVVGPREAVAPGAFLPALSVWPLPHTVSVFELIKRN